MTRDQIIQWAEEKAKNLLATLQDLIEPDEEGNPFIPWNQGEGHIAAALVEAYEVGDRAGMERACALVCHDCSRNFFPAVFKNGRWVHPSEHIDWSCKASAIRAAMEEGKP